MTTNPLDQRDLAPPSTVKFLMRYAIEEPELGWKQMPTRRAGRFFSGCLRIPELANLTLRSAAIQVCFNNGKVARVPWIEVEEWTLNAEGAIGQEEGVRRTFDKICGRSRTVCTPSFVDAKAIKLCLGRAFSEM